MHTLCFLHYRHAMPCSPTTELSGIDAESCCNSLLYDVVSLGGPGASFFYGACPPKTALNLGSAVSALSTRLVTLNAHTLTKTKRTGNNFRALTFVFVAPRFASNDSAVEQHIT